MSSFARGRIEIWTGAQHPYKHPLSDFFYSNPAFGNHVVNLQQAMDWILAVLYPNSKPSVDTVADLPAVGNTLNDNRVVNDDGTGKAQTWRWEQREGEATPSWHLIYDMDWGFDSVLTGFLLKTADMYVYRQGYDDLDAAGVPLTGILSGQHVYGGVSAGTHLNLHANSGDGTGPQSGYVQVWDNVRPYASSAVSLGTDDERFLKVWTDEMQAGTLVATGGSITDSSGLIDFDDENLVTLGYVRVGNTLTLSSGSIVDVNGSIDFQANNLSTIGQVSCSNVMATSSPSFFASGTQAGSLVFADGSITDSSGQIDFGICNLFTQGQVSCETLAVNGSATISGLMIASNQIFPLTTDQGLTLMANGAGSIDLMSYTNVYGDFNALAGFNASTGTFTGQLQVYSLLINSSDGISTSSGADLGLYPDTGIIYLGGSLLPNNAGMTLGDGTLAFGELWLSDAVLGPGGINVGAENLSKDTLKSLTNVYGTTTGQSLFWNHTTKKWEPSIPDTEINHHSIANLTSGDDHTQYALLAGRSGGQVIYGDTAASGNITIGSTANATKGSVLIGGKLSPTTANTYDMGAVGAEWKDIYMLGQAHGLRLENFTTAGRPSASASNIGRAIWDTDLSDMFIDRGGTWQKASLDKCEIQDAWNGSVATKTYTVSSYVSDARMCNWHFKDNTNDFEQLGIKITTPSSTQVTITSSVNLPAGTYTLVGVG
jgi:hypothetical protein